MEGVAWSLFGLMAATLAVVGTAYFRLSARIEEVRRDLTTQIEAVRADLGARLDANTARIDALNTRLDAHLQAHAG